MNVIKKTISVVLSCLLTFMAIPSLICNASESIQYNPSAMEEAIAFYEHESYSLKLANSRDAIAYLSEYDDYNAHPVKNFYLII